MGKKISGTKTRLSLKSVFQQKILLQFGVGVIIVLFVGLLLTLHLLDIERIPQELNPSYGTDSIDNSNDKKTVVPIGVISRYAPYLIYDGYQPIMDYLSSNSDFEFVLVLGTSYVDAAEKLLNGDVEAAFLGTQIYLEKSIDNNIVPVLAPLNEEGQPYFHSIMITRDSSPIRHVEDIVGHSLALPSKSSFSGKQMKHFLSTHYDLNFDSIQIKHFDHHQTVVRQVLKGNYEAGVIKERVLHEFADQGIRTIVASPPIPASPIVIRANNHNPAVSEMIRLLLALDVKNPGDRILLQTWDTEFANGFAKVDASNYEKLRELFPSLARGDE